jgi:hypothetical protein
MSDAHDLGVLLARPAVVAAVRELGLTSLSVEDVFGALRAFGAVRLDVTTHPKRPYVCVLQVAGEDPVHSRGTSVLHSALGCWAATLESFEGYAGSGLTEVERFLAGLDEAA